jgi:hypothetical protein
MRRLALVAALATAAPLHAELPAAVRLDLVTEKIMAAVDGPPEKLLELLVEYDAVAAEAGAPPSPTLQFLRGKALLQKGDVVGAKGPLEIFLTAAERGSARYREALKLYNRANEEEARRRAEEAAQEQAYGRVPDLADYPVPDLSVPSPDDGAAEERRREEEQRARGAAREKARELRGRLEELEAELATTQADFDAALETPLKITHSDHNRTLGGVPCGPDHPWCELLKVQYYFEGTSKLRRIGGTWVGSWTVAHKLESADAEASFWPTRDVNASAIPLGRRRLRQAEEVVTAVQRRLRPTNVRYRLRPEQVMAVESCYQHPGRKLHLASWYHPNMLDSFAEAACASLDEPIEVTVTTADGRTSKQQTRSLPLLVSYHHEAVLRLMRRLAKHNQLRVEVERTAAALAEAEAAAVN